MQCQDNVFDWPFLLPSTPQTWSIFLPLRGGELLTQFARLPKGMNPQNAAPSTTKKVFFLCAPSLLTLSLSLYCTFFLQRETYSYPPCEPKKVPCPLSHDSFIHFQCSFDTFPTLSLHRPSSLPLGPLIPPHVILCYYRHFFTHTLGAYFRSLLTLECA